MSISICQRHYFKETVEFLFGSIGFGRDCLHFAGQQIEEIVRKMQREAAGSKIYRPGKVAGAQCNRVYPVGHFRTECHIGFRKSHVFLFARIADIGDRPAARIEYERYDIVSLVKTAGNC